MSAQQDRKGSENNLIPNTNETGSSHDPREGANTIRSGSISPKGTSSPKPRHKHRHQSVLYSAPAPNFVVILFGAYETTLMNIHIRKGSLVDYLRKLGNLPKGCEVTLFTQGGSLVDLDNVDDNADFITELLVPGSTYIPCIVCRNEFGDICDLSPCLEDDWPKEEPQLLAGFQEVIDAANSVIAKREAKMAEENRLEEEKERLKEQEREAQKLAEKENNNEKGKTKRRQKDS